MNLPDIVTKDEWLTARTALLSREKNFTRERDELSKAHRAQPMVKVEKEYVFDGPQGPVALLELFEGRRQLIVYHFMFGPEHRSAGCKHCSCVMDNIAGGLVHLAARDTSFVAISRKPIATIEAFKTRMQWTFPWVSSVHNEFNYDYHVTLDPGRGYDTHNYRKASWAGEMPGISVFFRHQGILFHSYSTYLRGLDVFLPMYQLLDVTPLGRQEESGNSMAAGEASWIRLHDEYPRRRRRRTEEITGGK